MSAIDDYLNQKSEPLHTVDCALRIPTTACSCGGDKLAEAARAELAALREENARLRAKTSGVEPMLIALRDTFKVFTDPSGIYGHDNGCPGHHADSAEDGCRACFARNCVEHVERLLADCRRTA